MEREKCSFSVAKTHRRSTFGVTIVSLHTEYTRKRGERLAYKVQSKNLLKKRTLNKTTPILTVYDQEISRAFEELETVEQLLFKSVKSPLYNHRSRRFPRLPETRHELQILN
ncbi:hypothetical protein T10_486 [Trichinella papuae]|uniref:Uncharacterized protein n=1 Tax=Trichinella papuae TaxID=268474 RepID=A0A0V1MUD6_9BILA|nr:hypothetical protein T10_486 [Trichinella papuae]